MRRPGTVVQGARSSASWPSRARAASLAASLLLSTALLSTGLPGLAGCGPSVHVTQESRVHFEHCYRLDHEPQVVPSHRLRCWQEWIRYYSRDQNKDRRSYAARRVRQIQQGNGATMQLSVPSQPSAVGVGKALLPTDVFRAPAATTPTSPAPPPSGTAPAPPPDPQRTR